MIPLKLKLWRIENIVVMKVLQQDESTRGKGTLWEDEETKMRIVSAILEPEGLHGMTICIKNQNEESDDILDSTTFKTSAEAKKHIERIKKVVANYNASLQQKETEETDDIEIHIAE